MSYRVQRVGLQRIHEIRDVSRNNRRIAKAVNKLRVLNVKVVKELEFFNDFPSDIEYQYDTLLLVKQYCMGPIRRLRSLLGTVHRLIIPPAPEFVLEKIRSIIVSLDREITDMIHGYRRFIVDVDTAISTFENPVAP
uniref:Uncharacterized protein n=1 Tax=Panagrolaimus sp. JU765 TaxID=591449 RepID=A0AC34QVE9_9BILA